MTGCRASATAGSTEIWEWIDKHPRARMVVLDVLASVRDHQKRDDNHYDSDYQAVRASRKLCPDRGIGGVPSTTSASWKPMIRSIPSAGRWG